MARKAWGPGFIAAVSGIELTNIILYMIFGAVYGFYSILFISIMFLATIYIQQAITLVYIGRGRQFSLVLRSFSKKLFNLYKLSIYISSNLILLVNVLVITYIYYLLFGGAWIPYIILFITMIFTLTNTYKFKSIDKILSTLSVLLLTYLIALIYLVLSDKTFNIINPVSALMNYPYYVLLAALWGSIASPYSLIIQEDAKSTDDLLPAYVFGVLIGSSIACYSYLSGINPSDIRMLIYLPFTPTISSKIVLIGISATVILASISVLLVNSAITANYKKILVSRYYSSLLFVFVFIASIILVSPLYRTVSSLETLLVDLTIYASSLVGLLFSMSVLILSAVLYYIYKSSREKIYRLNASVLLIIAIISLSISFKGIIDVIIELLL